MDHVEVAVPVFLDMGDFEIRPFFTAFGAFPRPAPDLFDGDPCRDVIDFPADKLFPDLLHRSAADAAEPGAVPVQIYLVDSKTFVFFREVLFVSAWPAGFF